MAGVNTGFFFAVLRSGLERSQPHHLVAWTVDEVTQFLERHLCQQPRLLVHGFQATLQTVRGAPDGKVASIGLPFDLTAIIRLHVVEGGHMVIHCNNQDKGGYWNDLLPWRMSRRHKYLLKRPTATGIDDWLSDKGESLRIESVRSYCAWTMSLASYLSDHGYSCPL